MSLPFSFNTDLSSGMRDKEGKAGRCEIDQKCGGEISESG